MKKLFLFFFAAVAISAAAAGTVVPKNLSPLTFKWTGTAWIAGPASECDGNGFNCQLTYDDSFDQYRAKIFAAVSAALSEGSTSVFIDHDNNSTTDPLEVPITYLERDTQNP